MSNVPNHIGFIMDGNGRWAKQRGKNRLEGHRAGLNTVDKVIELSGKYGIRYVSLYVFSTENWSRPQKEIDGLFGLARNYLKKTKNFSDKNIRVVISGSLENIPQDLAQAIQKIQSDTKHCDGLVLNLCINYGGIDEIIRAVNAVIASGQPQIDAVGFRQYLYSPIVPDMDLIVRTSGELRLSNFMLFRAAYAELYFTDVLWPDFDETQFLLMLDSFKQRSRRFGDVQEIY